MDSMTGTLETPEKTDVRDKIVSPGDKIEVLIKELMLKPSWGSKDVIEKLRNMRNSIGNSMKDVIDMIPSPKKIKVDAVKKYDVLYLAVLGVPHYFLVHRVAEDTVTGIIFSSKDKSHSIYQIQKDRFFKHSYATSTYLSVDLEDALSSFVRVYENRSEADLIFNMVRDFYTKALNTKHVEHSKR